jgi:hypothetical protein
MSITDKDIERFVEIATNTSDSIIKDLTKENNNDPLIIRSISIVERYIIKKKLVVYGGTAINAILPESLKFYNTEYDLPDWDFYSSNPIIDGMNIADQIMEETGANVQLSTAVHAGTYKVYADGIAVADITEVHADLLEIFRKNAIEIDGVLYSGPDYLRMAAYLELSRPIGQPDRWEKVMRRLLLLNNAYPIIVEDQPSGGLRPPLGPPPPGGGTSALGGWRRGSEGSENEGVLTLELVEGLIELQQKDSSLFAFMGDYAIEIIRRTLRRKDGGPVSLPELTEEKPMIFLASNPEKFMGMFQKMLPKRDDGNERFFIEPVITPAEFLGTYYCFRDTQQRNRVLFVVMETTHSCQSILTLRIKGNPKITIASIESMIYLYLSLLFVPKSVLGGHRVPVSKNNIMSSVDYLIKVQYRILIEQRKSLLPLPVACIGEQLTMRQMRKDKVEDIRRILYGKGKISAEYFLRNIRYTGGDSKMRRLVEKSLEMDKKE